MSFTITKEGVVYKPRVISSIPSDKTFHREALRALLKFKYKPRVIDGNPVVTYATITLVFKL